jgi:hypothetical protein
MIKRLSMFSAAVFAATSLFASNADAQDFQVQVTSEFTEFSLQFTGGIADPYTIVWNVMEREGQLALCGAGFLRDARFNTAIRQIARSGSLMVDGQPRPVNLTFFRSARSINNLRSGAANCQVVGPLPRTNEGVFLQYGGVTVRL